MSSGSESPLSDSPQRNEEDEIVLSKLFKKEDGLVPQIKDNDEEYLISEPVKGKSPNKNEKTKLTPGKKRRRKDDTEIQGGSFVFLKNICIHLYRIDDLSFPPKDSRKLMRRLLDCLKFKKELNKKILFYDYAGKASKRKTSEKPVHPQVRSFSCTPFFTKLAISLGKYML